MLPAGFRAFDADNHYHQAHDAFTRHIEPRFRTRCAPLNPLWARADFEPKRSAGGGPGVSPTATPPPLRARPGTPEAELRGAMPGPPVGLLEAEAPPAAYRDRDARLLAMDELRLDGALFFPGAGTGPEHALGRDLPALLAASRAFNRWLEEDWGFAYQERIYAAPLLTLADPEHAFSELLWALRRDARVLVLPHGPASSGHGGTTSPADPALDPFWALAAEAGVTIVHHGGSASFGRPGSRHGGSPGARGYPTGPVRGPLGGEPIADTLAALSAHGVLTRHPRLRFAAVGTGAAWVVPLLTRLGRSYARHPRMWAADPCETLRDRLWVTPSPGDDLAELRTVLGADRIMMGSGRPYTEGAAQPPDFASDLANAGYTARERIQVMRTNAEVLVQPPV